MPVEKNKICFELKISLSEENKEKAAHILDALDVGDYVYGEIDCDLEAEYDPSQANTDLYEKLHANSPLTLYSEDKEYLFSIQQALQLLFPKAGISIEPHTFVLQEIADQNWRESWKQSFKPVLVKEAFAILPPWENSENFSQKFKIVIDPGMAFGTGQHETTRLCLEMMLDYPPPARFLDVGTGSGILCIAAQLWGAQFILGNDIDPECMAVAKENAHKNGVENIEFVPVPIHDIHEKEFDMVIANIQSRPLKKLIPNILQRTAKKGVVILSGILGIEKEEFCEFLQSNHARVLKTQDLNHWCVIVCERNS